MKPTSLSTKTDDGSFLDSRVNGLQGISSHRVNLGFSRHKSSRSGSSVIRRKELLLTCALLTYDRAFLVDTVP